MGEKVQAWNERTTLFLAALFLLLLLKRCVELAATCRDCENPAKHYQAAKNQTDSRYKTLVGQVIAISRTPPWLPSG